ncbi:MAG: purine-nucleoside phosphorylase [Coriobacteriales bacterium]|nr:purine-nucleoside phosphorylase [Coriobacteriales bacterium]
MAFVKDGKENPTLTERIQEAVAELAPVLDAAASKEADTSHSTAHDEAHDEAHDTSPRTAPSEACPRTVLILGSGLGELATEIEASVEIPYEEIPHCKTAGAPGHQGSFIVGTLAGTDAAGAKTAGTNMPSSDTAGSTTATSDTASTNMPSSDTTVSNTAGTTKAGTEIICLKGRLHAYEGHTPLETTFPLLVAHALGAQNLIVTNAAGAINKSFEVGDLMLITDHINFTRSSPVTFSKENDLITSFFDMTNAYAPTWQKRVRHAAQELNCTLREGVYLGVRGPAFETPAEIRAFRSLGADAVGMSTVHEVTMARALGMEVCGISLLSNMAAGILDKPITPAEVNEAAAASADILSKLIKKIVVSS